MNEQVLTKSACGRRERWLFVSKRYVSVIVAVMLFLAVVIAGCSKGAGITTNAGPSASPTTSKQASTQTPVDPVKIGILEDMTGAVGVYGTAYREGQNVLIKMVNEAGGIKSLGGAKIVVADGVGDSTVATATSEVERLINSEKVVAISGPTSTGEALASIPLFERYKIPAVTILGDATQYQKGYRYLFGTILSQQDRGIRQADFVDWLAKNQGAPMDRIAVAYITPSYSGTAQALVTRLAELGYKNVIMNESFPLTVTDQSPLVLKMKAANPTLVIYLGAGTDGVLFHKACATYDYAPWLVMDDTAYGSAFVRDGLPADSVKKILTRPNIFGVGPGVAGDLYSRVASLKAFQDAYKKAYPNSNSLPAVVGQGAAKMAILIKAIENAGSRDPEAIASALRKVVIQSPDPLIVFSDQYPRIQMTESGLIAPTAINAEQWADNLTDSLLIWPEAVANAKPRIQK